MVEVLMLRSITVSSLIGLCFVFAVAQSTPPKSKAGVDVLPDGPGKEVVQKNCLSCHSVRIATSKRGTEDDWSMTVSQMIGRGANISDDDAETIVEYMAKHFGPDDSKHNEKSDPKSALTAPIPESNNGEVHPGVSKSVNDHKAGTRELEASQDLLKPATEAIIHYREQNGDFKGWEQVAKVPGADAPKIKDHQKAIVF